MKEKTHITKSKSGKGIVLESPVRETDAELTPKAEAKVANNLRMIMAQR